MKYDGLYEQINWARWSKDAIADFLISYPDQTLARFYILEHGFLTNTDAIKKVFLFFEERTCQTCDRIIELFSTQLPEELTVLYFLKKENKLGNCSYYNLYRATLILQYCLLSPGNKKIMEEKKSLYAKQEETRQSTYQGGGDGRH